MYAHIIMGCSVSFHSAHANSIKESGEDRPKATATARELKQGLLRAMFDAASKEDALEVNRRKIYKLWREEGGDDE